ncbi:MAG: hypothetical protein PUC29_01810, partial [Clostridia bacterium]|nr:hypothetical protein [Clostridia bacterium]
EGDTLINIYVNVDFDGNINVVINKDTVINEKINDSVSYYKFETDKGELILEVKAAGTGEYDFDLYLNGVSVLFGHSLNEKYIKKKENTANGFLKYIKYNNKEILKEVYYVLLEIPLWFAFLYFNKSKDALHIVLICLIAVLSVPFQYFAFAAFKYFSDKKYVKRFTSQMKRTVRIKGLKK